MIFLKRRALMTRASFNYKTVNGIGSIVLENCVETKFKRLSLFGNSAQGENPSIESPQEIKNSGKYDETSGKYVIDVSVTGKNLVPPELDFVPFGNNDPKTIEFDPKTNSYKLITRPDNFNQVTCYVKFNLKKGIYTITQKIKIDGVDITNPQGLQIIDADTKENLFYQHTGINRKFELKKDTNVLINLGHFTEKTQKEAILCEVQLEKSDVPTPYEPYHEQQTLTIPLDRPLTKWDKIEKRDGVWGVACQTGHMALTGNDEKDGGKWYEGHNNLYSQYHIEFADNRVYYKRGEYEKYAYCNVFKAGTLIDRNTIDDIIFVTKGVYTAIGICSKRWSNLDGFKKYLQENPLEAIYRTSKEEFVPLPEETQLVLESLYTFDGTTVITVDSGEVETGIEVEYAVKE